MQAALRNTTAHACLLLSTIRQCVRYHLQFETVVKPCLEAVERDEPEGFQQLLESKLLLKASPGRALV